MKKTIIILLDGIGDRSYEVLGHRTPLQAAATPNLDRLAFMGSNGLFHAARPGQCLPSEMAHFLLFGYELNEFPGRGLLEAVGEGVSFDDSDVLCLAHVASVTSHEGLLTLVQKRPELDEAELGQLFSAISNHEAHGIRFRLQQTRRNDAILIASGRVSPYVSDSDPMVVGQKMARILPISKNPEPEQAEMTAQAFNAYLNYAYKALTEHEVNRQRRNMNLPQANFLATQRCGRRITQEPFDQRWGMAGMMIASGSMYAGLAHEIGLTLMRVKDSSDPGEDIRDRIRLALTDASHNFIHVHTKVPDEAAHTGDPKQKEAAIAALDSGLDELTKAAENRDDLLVVVTADHSTPSMSSLIHSGEPVPVTLVGSSIRRDAVDAFDEVRAAGGCLGLLRGKELMLTILNHADRSALLGHHLGGEKRTYFPRSYESFKLTD
jgi:2,3-bisphosphoglycerate-independent phosphoglycerate mutase